MCALCKDDFYDIATVNQAYIYLTLFALYLFIELALIGVTLRARLRDNKALLLFYISLHASVISQSLYFTSGTICYSYEFYAYNRSFSAITKDACILLIALCMLGVGQFDPRVAPRPCLYRSTIIYTIIHIVGTNLVVILVVFSTGNPMTLGVYGVIIALLQCGVCAFFIIASCQFKNYLTSFLKTETAELGKQLLLMVVLIVGTFSIRIVYNGILSPSGVLVSLKNYSRNAHVAFRLCIILCGETLPILFLLLILRNTSASRSESQKANTGLTQHINP